LKLEELNPLIVSIIIALISGIIGPAIMIGLNNWSNRNKGKGDYSLQLQEITEKAVEDLKQEKEDSQKRDEGYKNKINELEGRIQIMEVAEIGPFEVVTQVVIRPKPAVIRSEIKLMRVESPKIDA
jgi:predicted negative regulator of RcsB-dependent stress response